MRNLLAIAVLLAACSGPDPYPPTCPVGPSPSTAAPVFVRNLEIGNTGWFSSPAAVDLDGDDRLEIVAPFYSIAVWDDDGALLDEVEYGSTHFGRVYPPGVVADLEGDGTIDVVVASGEGAVTAYSWVGGELALKAGWPASTCVGGSCPENRSLAAADLDHDGRIEIIAGSTLTSGQGHVWVWSPDGTLYQPAGLGWPAWPRYNTASGPGGDADVNCDGHDGYGMFGENLGVGNIDDDAELEIIATYDNHEIQVFNPDGSALLADPTYYTHRSSACDGEPLSWGQFIRFLDPAVEDAHYHLHTGDWPGPDWTYWLQWTASPPSVADIDGDGEGEVVGFPNVEMDEPYHTYHYALFVLEGDHASNGHASARRNAAFDTPPLSEEPWQDDDWYPVAGIPAPAFADLVGDARPEIVVSLNDGYVYAFSPDGGLLWRHNVSGGRPFIYSSEPAIADLDGDGSNEIVVGVWGAEPGDGRMLVLRSNGEVRDDVVLPGQQADGNGVGAAAAPTIADLDGDGRLEVLLLTIDHGLDVFSFPGSSSACALTGVDPARYPGPWTTGRGNYLRNGLGPTGAP
jgi:hypothetical protein